MNATVRNIYCIGRNYAEHAKEMGHTLPEDPVVFTKPNISYRETGAVLSWPKTLGRASNMQGQVQFPAAMPARAGLGLTVSSGSAQFRNATIEPIKVGE